MDRAPKESIKIMSDQVLPCRLAACPQCPWRVRNRNKPAPEVEGHRYHWYAKANLKRLWSALRRGESMTCHPTDPRSCADWHETFPKPETQPCECAGATILAQREFMLFQEMADMKRYRRERPFGLTRDALRQIVERHIFGQIRMARPMGKPDLNDADVQYEPLGIWIPK